MLDLDAIEADVRLALEDEGDQGLSRHWRVAHHAEAMAQEIRRLRAALDENPRPVLGVLPGGAAKAVGPAVNLTLDDLSLELVEGCVAAIIQKMRAKGDELDDAPATFLPALEEIDKFLLRVQRSLADRAG